MESLGFDEKEFLACCGSTQFAKEMVLNSPFYSYAEAVVAARDIWFTKVDVNGWLEAFSAHPQIGQSPSSNNKSDISAQWSKGEQSNALATATNSSLQELYDWNAQYRKKFGFVFLICASGKSTSEILGELKKRFPNKPIVEFEIAAQEQMKVTELRLAKLFSSKSKAPSTGDQYSTLAAKKAEEDRVNIIGGHLTAASETSTGKTTQISTRTRPPITTHVLDVARGSPAAGVEVRLEMWKGNQPLPLFGDTDTGGWVLTGSSATDNDGRSGQLMSIVDAVDPGIYRISFNTKFFEYFWSQGKGEEGKMQAVKDKLHDMSAMHKVKAETKAEEKEEKEIAKARIDIAHEVRLAKEAEAAMELHVAKADQKAKREIKKHEHEHTHHPNSAPDACGGATGGGTNNNGINISDVHYTNTTGAPPPTDNLP